MTLPVNFDCIGVDAILADWVRALQDFGVESVLVLGPKPTGGVDEREVLAVHPPRMLSAAEALADSSINFDIRWWTSSQPAEFRESQSEVIMAIKSALDEAGIEIPFPQRTLTFPEPLSLRSKTERPREASAQAN